MVIPEQIIQGWLDGQCAGASAGFAGALSAWVGLVLPNGALSAAAAWPRGQHVNPDLTNLAGVAVQRKQPVLQRPGALAKKQLVSCPVRQGEQTIGVLSLELEDNGQFDARATFEKVVNGAASLSALLAAAPDRRASEQTQVLALMASALAQGSLRDAAGAFSVEAARQLHCERVSVGLIERDQVRLVGLSTNVAFEKEHSLSQQIAACMQECVDQRASIVLPSPSDQMMRITRAHAELVRRTDQRLVCSVPLVKDQRMLGAITLEFAREDAFDRSRLNLIEHVACIVGPILDLMQANERSLWARVRTSVRQRWSQLFGPGNLKLKTWAAATVLGVLCLSLLPVPFRVSAPARLEGALQRVLVAPSDGFLHQVHVRAGDTVQAQQLLAELADEDLKLEERKWQAELAQHEHAYGEALALQDRAQIVIAQARVAQARAQLELVQENLARTQIRAPFAGVVISGDLSQSLGAPLKRGDTLFSLAPTDAYRVIVHVDERDIAYLKPGQRGSLVLASAPQQPLVIEVKRMTPVASVIKGRNRFEVQAEVKQNLPSLRPGLEGIAKVHIRHQPFLRTLTYRLQHFLALNWWVAQ